MEAIKIDTRNFNKATKFFRDMELNFPNEPQWGKFGDALDEAYVLLYGLINPVPPATDRFGRRVCGNCLLPTITQADNYCPHCGRKVLWE